MRRPRSAAPTTADLWMERFGDQFVPVTETGCWVWLGPLNPYGYGAITAKRRSLGAHRLSYELLRGPIPKGLQIDHLCRVRCCVNPDHMEIVTLHENLRRGFSPSAIHARKTHCIRGHEFTPENTYRHPNRGRGGRACRICQEERSKAWKQRIHIEQSGRAK